MPPARTKALDDSRSETSSTITNLKDKLGHNTTSGLGISKLKRGSQTAGGGPGNHTKMGLYGSATTTAESDTGLPRTDWNTIQTNILHNYRNAYRLSTPSGYSNPHANLIYNTSETALRAPSAVLTRRRLHALKQQRRKLAQLNNGNAQAKAKSKEMERLKEKVKPGSKENIAQSIEVSNTNSDLPPSSLPSTVSVTSLSSTDLRDRGRQHPAALANSVRKHFNAQQLNETETIARFTYVVHQGAAHARGVKTEGSEGDGAGWWMGSHGRAVKKGEGGEVGFRLRFRP